VHDENLSKHLPSLGNSDFLVEPANKMVLNLEPFVPSLFSSLSSSTSAIDIPLVQRKPLFLSEYAQILSLPTISEPHL
jgi:hypothetical protein